jgi:L-ascorbate metabolism protein UlaG (beta-lactamase superfamily)
MSLGAAAIGLTGWAIRNVPAALGGSLTGARAERARHSPQYRDGKFHNSTPSTTLAPGTIAKTLGDMIRGREQRTPRQPIPVLAGPAPAATEGLHITWYGHASTLIEIDGRRVLFDPQWSDRCSPSHLVGPRRLHPNPVELADLPRLDAIVISHDHYDHLDMSTVKELARTQSAPFLVPLGVGAHLDRWGVAPERIIELDWDESATVADVQLTVTAARHFSGRGFTRDTTLWGSWVVAGPSRRVFYTGDTGYFEGFARIGAEHGPFDAALIQVGAYGDAWPDIHMTPEDGVQAHVDVRGGLMIPVHWCTFVLALHEWGEPADRVWQEAKVRSVPIAVPKPSERIDVDVPPEVDGWWQALA